MMLGYHILAAFIDTFSLVNRVASHVPGYSCVSARVLDSLFGPEDELTYVSTTAAPRPPIR